jgi:hypothetical protein
LSPINGHAEYSLGGPTMGRNHENHPQKNRESWCLSRFPSVLSAHLALLDQRTASTTRILIEILSGLNCSRAVQYARTLSAGRPLSSACIPTLNSRPADDVETTSGETVPDSEFSD